MRVDPIFAFNSSQQHNPHTTQKTGASSGKAGSGIIFKEYLSANLQQASTPAVTPQVENQMAGLLMGYFTALKISSRTESKLEDNAS